MTDHLPWYLNSTSSARLLVFLPSTRNAWLPLPSSSKPFLHTNGSWWQALILPRTRQVREPPFRHHVPFCDGTSNASLEKLMNACVIEGLPVLHDDARWIRGFQSICHHLRQKSIPLSLDQDSHGAREKADIIAYVRIRPIGHDA